MTARLTEDPGDRRPRTWSQAGLASLRLDAGQRRRPPAPPAPSVPQVRVVPVPEPGGDDLVHDVACSVCGVLTTRVLAVAAEEEASWHLLRAFHTARASGAAPTITADPR